MTPENGPHPAPDLRRYSPAIARNRDVVRDRLAAILLEARLHHKRLLEIGSGTGEHAAHSLSALPGWRWSPSDATEADFDSIRSWRQCCAPGVSDRIDDPILLDCLQDGWSDQVKGTVDVVFCANVIHITPPSLWPRLVTGAARLLSPGGILAFYGPFRRQGQHTSPSNVAFDDWLKEKDPSFAVRDWEEICAAAQTEGFSPQPPVAVPANNFVMHLKKAAI